MLRAVRTWVDARLSAPRDHHEQVTPIENNGAAGLEAPMVIDPRSVARLPGQVFRVLKRMRKTHD
jgi:hypothetical protein